MKWHRLPTNGLLCFDVDVAAEMVPIATVTTAVQSADDGPEDAWADQPPFLVSSACNMQSDIGQSVKTTRVYADLTKPPARASIIVYLVSPTVQEADDW